MAVGSQPLMGWRNHPSGAVLSFDLSGRGSLLDELLAYHSVTKKEAGEHPANYLLSYVFSAERWGYPFAAKGEWKGGEGRSMLTRQP